MSRIDAPAAEAFARLVDEIIWPPLRALAFKKQARIFRKRSPRGWMVLSTQKSDSSTRDQIRFTINLGVRYERLHRLDYPNATWMWDKAPSETDCHWRERIGYLMEPPGDRWWTVTDRAGAERLAPELAALIPRAAAVLDSVLSDDSNERDLAGRLYPGKPLPDAADAKPG